MARTDADTIYHTQKMKGEIEDADRPFAGDVTKLNPDRLRPSR
jgi:hypothetical protein